MQREEREAKTFLTGVAPMWQLLELDPALVNRAHILQARFSELS
jgi:hypothetical protein